jgi:PKD repeat protein
MGALSSGGARLVGQTPDFDDYYVYLAVYDPGPGRGWMVQKLGPPYRQFLSLGGVNHGVVNYTVTHDLWISQLFSTYDPAKGQWVENHLSNGEFMISGSPLYKDGVAAIVVDDTLHYGIYDTANGGYWKNGFETLTDHPVITGISYGTVQFTVNGVSDLRGYDWKTQIWAANGKYTRAYAGFVAQPNSGNPPLNVWLTEVSFGTDSDTDPLTRWTYTFGDGNTMHARSPYHVYTDRLNYTCSLNYFNSTYIDTESVTIYCNDVTAPVVNSFTINYGEVSTNNPTVVLTFSVTDNTGTVAQQSFSDTQIFVPSPGHWEDLWTDWEAFNPNYRIKQWTFTNRDNGTKRVKARFRDPSGNVSAIASDSIQLKMRRAMPYMLLLLE